MKHGSRILEFPQHGDKRGWLVAIEENQDIPFAIRRIFYIYGSDDSVVRGQHANRRSEFVLINVRGSCRVRTVETNGEIREFVLEKPHTGIYIPRMVWKDMYGFSSDSILLCLASEHYDGEEYIRDFDAFRKELSIPDES